jgi:hypothetical protein
MITSVHFTEAYSTPLQEALAVTASRRAAVASAAAAAASSWRPPSRPDQSAAAGTDAAAGIADASGSSGFRDSLGLPRDNTAKSASSASARQSVAVGAASVSAALSKDKETDDAIRRRPLMKVHPTVSIVCWRL